MKLHNGKRGLTRDFISLILNDMKNLERQANFIRNSVDFSSSEHQNAHNKIKHILAIKEAMHELNLIVSDYCIEQVNTLRRASQRNVLEVDFLDTIDPRAVIQKREAALMCGRSESWLQKGDHKNRFKNERNGAVNVLSFVSYLKEFKVFEYEAFVKNYQKHVKSKIG